MAVTIMSDADVNNECAGLLAQVGSIVPDTDAIVAFMREAAIADFERDCQTYLRYRRVCMLPGAADIKGDTYDVEESAHDYVRMRNAAMLPSWTMRRRPIKWGTTPHMVVRPKPDTEFFTIPDDWIRVDYLLGIIDLFPVTTLNVTFGAWPAFVMSVLDSSLPQSTMPHFVSITYTAGWYDETTDTELPQELDGAHAAIMARVRWLLYQSFGDIIPNTQALDGFTQGFDSLEQRMKRADDAYQAFVRRWCAEYGPPNMSIN